jgi:CubicO group peptidase (beta-lactamase class C family)
MLLNGGALDGARVLKPETVRLMTQNQIGPLTIAYGIHGDKFGYGFGVVTPDARDKTPASAGSYSWGGLFDTFFWVDPEKQLVGVVMAQLYPFGHLPLWADYQKLAYAALAE